MSQAQSDRIFAEWRALEQRITMLAKECERDPQEAALRGISVEIGEERKGGIFGGIREAAPYNEKAGWLRAAAEHVLGSRSPWQWDVREAIGGACFLVLTAYNVEPTIPDSLADLFG